jgi:hypothetical protein
MRKLTLSLMALMLAVTAYCGVPQAINYQAVALSSTGAPLKLKSVAFRLSILDGSAVGPVAYQERQSVTTDLSGLASLQLGNGTALSGTFAGVDWSKGSFYLKTEIDTTGGTSYITVGTIQFFSVPFALYADKAGQANLSSPEFPDGLNNITPVRMDGSFAYTVPVGKTLYITQITHNNSGTCSDYGAVIDGVTVTSSIPSGGIVTGAGAAGAPTSNANKYVMDNAIVAPEGKSVISSSCGTSLVGFTVPKGYSWVLFDLSTGNYTVPAGKVLVIKNIISSSSGWNKYYSVGGLTTQFNKNVSFADQGQTVSASGLTGPLLMMGYLKNR